MEPQTKERLMAFRRANRKMPTRRVDLPMDQITYKNPELLAKFCTETGKIVGRRTTGLAAHIHRRIGREIKRARALNLMS